MNSYLFSQSDLEAATQVVYSQMNPSAQIHWPQLTQHTDAHVIVKHENHNPTGAFKVRGGITFMNWLKRTHPEARGIITATRGNHGQSQARAAVALEMMAKICVPHGNSAEKNQAMRAYGGEVIEHGQDFEEAKDEAMRVAATEDLFVVPPFHPELVRGVATYGYELMSAHPDLDTIYVPIGCGSGICGTIAARDALGLKTKIVAVVSQNAQTAKLSFDAGDLVPTNTAITFADGMAVRDPVRDAFDIYARGADRMVVVSDDEVAHAMRVYFSAIHNVSEGAGAASLAALIQERTVMAGKKTGVILTGGNVDTAWFSKVLQGETPKP